MGQSSKTPAGMQKVTTRTLKTTCHTKKSPTASIKGHETGHSSTPDTYTYSKLTLQV